LWRKRHWKIYDPLPKEMLKAEFKRKNMTYADLVAALGKIRIEEAEVNIHNKIARGGFAAMLLIQCLKAVGVKELRL
jgi:hypothetical protein